MSEICIQKDQKEQLRIPWWLLPGILALDAPLVALLWQELVAHAWTVQLIWPERAALGLTVWGIYLLDHFWDARREADHFRSPRHRIAREYPAGFLLTGLLSLALAAWLAMTRIPSIVCTTAIPVALLTGGYLVWRHLRSSGTEFSLFRSLIVAAIFSGGILAAPVALLWSPPPGYSAILLLLIALLACNHRVVSEAEERENGRPAGAFPPALPLALAIAALFLLSASTFAIAAALSFSSLAAVGAIRQKISPPLQGFLADLSLLLPAICLFFL